MEMDIISMLVQEVGVWGAFTIVMWWIGEKRSNKREENLIQRHNDREERLLEVHNKREVLLASVIKENQEIIVNLSSALDEVKEVKLDIKDIKDFISK